ncbi:MAG: hypothetical protein Q4A69_00420 [Moraxella sp.]|nr:hypothetical protein [Moraxella sp.]
MPTLKFMVTLGCLVICQASFAKSEILLKPSANQRQAVKSAFISADNAQIRTAVNEAKANIETLAINASCSMGYYVQGIAAIRSPNVQAQVNLWSPTNGMQYLAKDKCLNVVRIGNWSMPAKNALNFNIIYESAESGENKSAHTEMLKQDGQWLVLSHL